MFYDVMLTVPVRLGYGMISTPSLPDLQPMTQLVLLEYAYVLLIAVLTESLP